MLVTIMHAKQKKNYLMHLETQRVTEKIMETVNLFKLKIDNKIICVPNVYIKQVIFLPSD